jgi:hypothetical protein
MIPTEAAIDFFILVFIALIFIAFSKNRKRASVISVVAIGAFVLYVRLTCGPDPRDVRVMKPMAEAISDYIIKHGVPESLRDIPNLPYRLEGCERKEEYWKTKIVGADRVSNIKDATGVIVKEKCAFVKNDRAYYVILNNSYDVKTLKKDISLEIGNDKSKTWDILFFHSESDGKIVGDNKISFGSSKHTGICSPMRQ